MSGVLGSPRALWAATTWADRVVSFGVVLLSIGLAAGMRLGYPPPERARVTVGGSEVALLELDEDRRLIVDGRLGPVVVVVEDAGLHVAESGCPQRLCISMGTKRRSGEMVACVPNGLVVRLEGGGQDPDVPDAVTR